MKTVARGVYKKAYLILHNRKLNLIKRTCFLKPGNIIFTLKSFDHSLFDNRLTVTYAEKSGVKRIALYREGVISTDPLLPRKSLGALKKLLEAFSLKG